MASNQLLYYIPNPAEIKTGNHFLSAVLRHPAPARVCCRTGMLTAAGVIMKKEASGSSLRGLPFSTEMFMLYAFSFPESQDVSGNICLKTGADVP